MNDGGRVHHGYGEHRGILVTVSTVTVTVFDFSIPHTLCTLTRGVQVGHGVGAAQTAGARWGACRAWAGVVIQRGWRRCQGDSDGGGTETAAAAAPRGQRQRHREGGGGGTERVVAAAQRGRWRQHREGGGGGTERSAAVARRGWADSVGGMSVWVGSTLGLRYVLLGGGSTRMGSVCALGVSSCVSACQGGAGTAGACWRARCVGHGRSQRWAVGCIGVGWDA